MGMIWSPVPRFDRVSSLSFHAESTIWRPENNRSGRFADENQAVSKAGFEVVLGRREARHAA